MSPLVCPAVPALLRGNQAPQAPNPSSTWGTLENKLGKGLGQPWSVGGRPLHSRIGREISSLAFWLLFIKPSRAKAVGGGMGILMAWDLEVSGAGSPELGGACRG